MDIVFTSTIRLKFKKPCLTAKKKCLFWLSTTMALQNKNIFRKLSFQIAYNEIIYKRKLRIIHFILKSAEIKGGKTVDSGPSKQVPIILKKKGAAIYFSTLWMRF